MVGKVQSLPVTIPQQNVAAEVTQKLDEVLDTFARVPSSQHATRSKALGKPGANVSFDDGSFNVSGSSVWNPLCWPIVTLCFGSFIGSRGLATTSSR